MAQRPPRIRTLARSHVRCAVLALWKYGCRGTGGRGRHVRTANTSRGTHRRRDMPQQPPNDCGWILYEGGHDGLKSGACCMTRRACCIRVSAGMSGQVFCAVCAGTMCIRDSWLEALRNMGTMPVCSCALLVSRTSHARYVLHKSMPHWSGWREGGMDGSG